MDIEALIAEKQKAVDEEDYLKAAEIKKQLSEIDLEALNAEKLQAVAAENYLRAAELKKAIDALKLDQVGINGGTNSSTSMELVTPSASPVKKPNTHSPPEIPLTTPSYVKTPLGKNSSFQKTPTSRGGSFQKETPVRTPSYLQVSDDGAISRPPKAPLTPSPTKAPMTPSPTKTPMGKNSSFLKSPMRRGDSFQKESPVRTPNYLSDDGAEKKNTTLNPIQTDPQLKEMIERLDNVDSFRSFKMWRSSFLNRFETFLAEDGTAPAQTVYTEFRKSMGLFVKQVKAVQGFVEKGDISVDRTTVKGRNSLNEMNKQLVEIIDEAQKLIPAKSAQERRRGYTKFHLGAILVRDGFKEHERMNMCSEILLRLKEDSLEGVADKQHLEEIINYDTALKRFRDILADLGLYEVMLKCWEYGEQGEELIFIDLKTGTIGGVPIKMCIERGFIHTVKDEKGTHIAYKEAVTEDEDRNAILGLVKEALKL
jgi:hypothetical protein